MTNIFDLLERRNEYFLRFLLLSQSFREKVFRGDLNDLELFYDNRESIINIIEHINTRLNEEVENFDEKKYPITKQAKTTVKSCLDYRDELVKKILDVDLELMVALDREKDKVIEELKQVGKTHKTFSSYKSEDPVKRVVPKYVDTEM
jgi:L-cysteine desulfidase